jgi:general stress protein CsbA
MPSLVINVTMVTFVTKVTYFHMVAVVTDVNVLVFVSVKNSVYTQHFIMVI